MIDISWKLHKYYLQYFNRLDQFTINTLIIQHIYNKKLESNTFIEMCDYVEEAIEVVDSGTDLAMSQLRNNLTTDSFGTGHIG